jgi:hypothetical protein
LFDPFSLETVRGFETYYPLRREEVELSNSPEHGAGVIDADEVIAARYFNGVPSPTSSALSSLPGA